MDNEVAKVAILTLAGMLESRGVLQPYEFADQLRANAEQLLDIPELAQGIRELVQAMEEQPPRLSLIDGGLADEPANDADDFQRDD